MGYNVLITIILVSLDTRRYELARLPYRVIINFISILQGTEAQEERRGVQNSKRGCPLEEYLSFRLRFNIDQLSTLPVF